jgi:hypothetical protein
LLAQLELLQLVTAVDDEPVDVVRFQNAPHELLAEGTGSPSDHDVGAV